jgi:hypothetical protein
MSFSQRVQQRNVSEGPDGLLHLAEVAASLDAPATDPAAAHVLPPNIPASVSAFSHALAAQLVASNGPAFDTSHMSLPQHWQQGRQQAAAAQQPCLLQKDADSSGASNIATALLQQLTSLKAAAMPPAAPLAGHPAAALLQLLQQSRQPAEGSTAAHPSNAALLALLRATTASATAGAVNQGSGFADESLGAYMPMPSAQLHRSSSRSSPAQHLFAGEEDDSDYNPAGHHSSRGGGNKPQQWTDAEQARLEALVAQHGTRNWSTIAARMPGRTGKQCRERYINNAPELKKVGVACRCLLLSHPFSVKHLCMLWARPAS